VRKGVRPHVTSGGPPCYFFEREEELRPREREVLLDLREEPARLPEREVLPVLRLVLPAALRVRDLAPVLRVLRAGFARRELEALFFAAVFFEERLEAPFVSPVLRRCLFTTRAASSSARSRLAPCWRADCLIFWYCLTRFGFFTPRGGIRDLHVLDGVRRQDGDAGFPTLGA
jgi:hypothetical protein